MIEKTCVVTGATAGIGYITARELARQGARVGLVGRDPDRAARPPSRGFRPRPARIAPKPFVADLSRPQEVRRAGRADSGVFSPARRARQQCRGHVHPARAHRRGPRTHLRLQPPGPFLADEPTARSPHGLGPGPSRQRRVRRPSHGPDRFREPSGRADLTEVSPLIASRSWPTSCSPTSWPVGWKAQGVTANSLHPGFVNSQFFDGAGARASGS